MRNRAHLRRARPGRVRRRRRPRSGSRPARRSDTPRLPGEAGALHRGALQRRVLAAAHRDQPHGDDPVRLREVRGDASASTTSSGRPPSSAARRSKDKAPPGYPFDDTDVYKVIEGAAYTLSVKPGPEARGLPRRPDREDRRRAGEGRLPLHDADDRPREPAPLGGEGALGAGEGGQPRALQPGPPLRGGGGALPGHRQADAARRGAADGGPARPDVRAGQAVDLARAPDHRDGPGQALPGHRRRALPGAREVPAGRARARTAPRARAASTTSRTRRWWTRARRSATPCARPTCTPAWPTWRPSPASRPT